MSPGDVPSYAVHATENLRRLSGQRYPYPNAHLHPALNLSNRVA